jgi:aminobenzoyl-glutamate transport protein
MVVIPPLAAVLYLGAKKHPIVGIICGYAGAQAGFSANVMIAGTDGLLQGITQPAVDHMLEGTGLKFTVDITCNWYFMIASTFLCAVVIGFVCNLIVDKRFGTYVPPEGMEIEEVQETTPVQKKALRIAGLVVLVYLLAVIAMTVFGPLGVVEGSDPEKRALVGSYFIKNLIPILFFMFAIPGVVFGKVSGKYKKFRDIAGSLTKQMSGMGSYVAFCFFCGQFQKLLAWTKIDTVMAIGGADLLNALNFKGFGMIVAFILLTGIINLIMPSGSAKWAILAPIFVPMLIYAGRYNPGFTQLIYRLGDSPTNAFTPLSPYLWVQLSVAQTKYDKNIKIGTLAAGLFPIGIILQVAWILFLAIWMLLGIDIGPGVNVHLPADVLPGIGVY